MAQGTQFVNGFGFEGPDPSVGIFGWNIWHEDCDLWEVMDDVPTTVTYDPDLKVDKVECTCGASFLTEPLP